MFKGQTSAIECVYLQVRSKISTFGGFGGPTEVPCGGNALKFYASVRLNIRRIGLIKKGEEVGTKPSVYRAHELELYLWTEVVSLVAITPELEL